MTTNTTDVDTPTGPAPGRAPAGATIAFAAIVFTVNRLLGGRQELSR